MSPETSSPTLTVYLTRHGESLANLEGKIGGNTGLSNQGKLYAKKLPDVLQKVLPSTVEKVTVWTSSLIRTLETIEHLPKKLFNTHRAWPELDEIDAGLCDGLTYEEVEQIYPEEAEARDQDKFNFRYKQGESYADVLTRIQPVMQELERVCQEIQKDVEPKKAILIVCHQAVLRCVYAVLMGQILEIELPYISIPLHTLIRVDWNQGGIVTDQRWKVNVPAVDTHREAQPQSDPLNIPNLSHFPDPNVQILSPGSFDTTPTASPIHRVDSSASTSSDTSVNSHSSGHQVKTAHFPLPLEIPASAANVHPSLAEHAKSHVSFVEKDKLGLAPEAPEKDVPPRGRRKSYFYGDSH